MDRGGASVSEGGDGGEEAARRDSGSAPSSIDSDLLMPDGLGYL